MAEQQNVSPMQAQLAALLVAVGVLLGSVIAFVITTGKVPGISSGSSTPANSPAGPDRRPDERGTQWVPTSEPRLFFGLREDGSVTWRRTLRIGDAPPTGSQPIGDKGPSK